METTTTQRPATLAERVLEGKRRELAMLEADFARNPDLYTPSEIDYVAQLRETIAWYEQRQAAKAGAAQR